MKKDLKKAVVIGAKWRDKVNGNTYHNAKIIIVNNDNTDIIYSGFKYGYDRAYINTAEEILKNDAEIIDGGYFYTTKAVLKNNNF